MEVFQSEIHQVFVKLLDGKHRILNFSEPSISVAALKHRIQTLTSIPSHLQLLLNNSHILHDHQNLTLAQSRENSPFPETLDLDSNSQLAQGQDFTQSRFVGSAVRPVGFDGSGKFPVVVHLSLRLRGGKGGFGSLLRGAATKAGQKKTNNFDACRDMSGRRLRHVNAEKKLEEWRAEAEERKLEKMAEEFIKKKAKEAVKSGKSNGSDSAEKYVAKYREDSAKCMEEVERSVRESIQGLMSSKRKNNAEGSESVSKRLKIWLGKRKYGDSDSEDQDDDDVDEEEEEENEKSVIIDNGSHSDSSRETEASSGSITGGKLDAGSLGRGSSESGSEEEDTVAKQRLKSDKYLDGCGENGDDKNSNYHDVESLEENRDYNVIVSDVPNNSHSSKVDELVTQQPGLSCPVDEVASVAEVRNSLVPEPLQEESTSMSANPQNLDMPLNFDEYQSAAELEVLGLERLKLELQARGLKCGGTLQERAARLFLLKTTPLEMLPKKLFAKK
ncbi:Replication stress response regulator SDE2 [Sesamum alatum]|uniref:Replication stress response regulator SDE2 n=1 Tax=Sesamum alatum TaxID=300844 RepID=A0AAE2CDV1_9LAMI|nr:Replication stress response regulator SDE2 [Sesamum alatum]